MKLIFLINKAKTKVEDGYLLNCGLFITDMVIQLRQNTRKKIQKARTARVQEDDNSYRKESSRIFPVSCST